MKFQFCLLDADYIEENGKSLIRLWGAGCKNHVCILTEYEPYFYVLPKNFENAKKQIKSVKGDFKITKIAEEKKIINGKKQRLLKIFCDLPQSVPKAREALKTMKEVKGQYEYAINFYRRYLIDRQFSGMMQLEAEGEKINETILAKKIRPLNFNKLNKPKLKTLAFDIETADNKIIMISLASDNLNRILVYRKTSHKHAEVVENEKLMIVRFAEIVREHDPDIILTYNGDAFDFPLLQERANLLKVNLAMGRDGSSVKFKKRARTSSAHITGRVHIDIYNFISNILAPQLQSKTLSLGSVAFELLGDKKIKMKFEDCLKDSKLTLKLGAYILPQIFELSKLVGQTVFDVSRMTYSQLVEWHLTKKAFPKYIIPNQPKWDEIQRRKERKKYIGGYVKEPIAGIHNDIAVLDFRSLYPSIIASFNISPETLDSGKKEDGFQVPESEHWFSKKEGFVSNVTKELIEKRRDIKKEVLKSTGEKKKLLNAGQKALKTITNALYGTLAMPSAKWYCYECAESAAAFGRYFIRKIIEEAGKENFTVIYADTDSCFVKTKKNNLDKKINVFLKKINKSLSGVMELELQGLYTRGIFIPKAKGTAKKRYALIDKKGVLTIRGLEKVRKDWSNAAKDTQEKVLMFILKDNDREAAVKYTKSIIRKLRLKKIPIDDLTIHEQLTKPLSKYKQIGPHVAVARKILERGKPINAGMIVIYAITKGLGSISERAEPIEDVKIDDIDEDYYINNQVIPAALRVLQVFGVTEEDLL